MYNENYTTTDFKTAILRVFPELESVTSCDIEIQPQTKEVK